MFPASRLFLALPSPCPGPTLHFAFDLRRHPTAVEVSFLRLYLFSIDVTVPRTCVETQIIFDRLYPAESGINTANYIRGVHRKKDSGNGGYIRNAP